MAIAAEEARPEGVQRGRGGFYRSIDGKPYVSDPSGALVKSGPRKGQLKRLAYGSPSNRGMQIENSTNLTKWGERRVVLGVGLDPEITASCAQLAGLDVDSDEYKSLADAIIVRAKEVAKANLAAERGTHVHALTEDHDESRDWVQRAEAGEILGLDPEVQTALVDGWKRMLEREGLEVLAIEASVVDDAWRLAGTLDRIVRTSKPLRFARHGGEIAEIPAGTVVVLDVKTSNKRLDRNGCVQYWNAYAIQIASYAQAVPYDTEAETRGTWPFEIDQAHALIAHPDIDTAEWELIYVDLVAGREHGGQCVVDAKAWEQRTDVFSVAMLPNEVAGGAPAPSAGDPDVPAGDDVPPSVAPSAAPTGTRSALDGPDPERVALVDARAQLPTTVDEGADLSGAEFGEGWATLQRHYGDLDEAAKTWLAYLIGEATKRGLTFHARHARTQRAFELYRGLIFLCEGGGDDDEILRALLAIELGDVALFPAIHPGHAVGALDAAAAQRFADLVVRYNATDLVGMVDDDGIFRLVA